ncbi:hypothetical protein QR680_002756 [Steinernema hermaphroditum]|uniref:Nuclear receptor domain-containing protein n=1 Tax=Steinernema hermaphroditum TaxID=289476 RepID=A0AA39LIB6_9BILA|nr:hypothetical protein QR680_002756 [Steinernema hermaphroditum]
MASGSQPSSQQRNAVSSRTAKPRSTSGRGAVPISDFCVVCGDRACSHHYYGVAACHGCKCFFWRSVKSKAEYVCRYNGNCEIDINGRNACRSCRFNRCLKAGMQPEAVRPQKTPLNDTQKANRAGNKRAAGKFEDHDSDGSHFDDRDMSASPPNHKKVRLEQAALINSFIQLQKIVDEGDQMPIKRESYSRIDSLIEAFEHPSLLDIYRSKTTYQIRLQRVTAEEMYDCRRRTLVSAFDWIRMIGNIERIANIQDKMHLLRNSYAPLTIFDMSVRTSQTTADPSLLCLPTGITVSKNEDTVSNCFLSKTLIENILDTLIRPMAGLEMDEMEVAMMKAIIVLNSETMGLSHECAMLITKLRDSVHAALYQHCGEQGFTAAAIRFAKLLHIIPKITLLARDLVEHIRMSQTFLLDLSKTDPLFYELFGDIFDASRRSSSSPISGGSDLNSPSHQQSPPASDASSFGPLNAISPVDVYSPQSNGLTTTYQNDCAPTTQLEDYGTLTLFDQPQTVGRSSMQPGVPQMPSTSTFTYWNPEYYVNTSAFDDIRQQQSFHPQYAQY